MGVLAGDYARFASVAAPCVKEKSKLLHVVSPVQALIGSICTRFVCEGLPFASGLGRGLVSVLMQPPISTVFPFFFTGRYHALRERADTRNECGA